MRANELILQLLEDRRLSQRTLARLTGSCPQTVNNRLRGSSAMKVDAFATMLDALGYEMRIVPKDVERPEYVLSARDPGDGKGDRASASQPQVGESVEVMVPHDVPPPA